MTALQSPIPNWALAVLSSPGGHGQLVQSGDMLHDRNGNAVARIVDGVVCCSVRADDPSIAFYKAAGGAQFHERSKVAYAMTTLDTPVYRAYLDRIRPDARPDAVIADIGGGDGRNAVPWLEAGFHRIIVVDPIASALMRLRQRIAASNPEWLPRLLLIEGDARHLPLRTESCGAVQSVEALEYLNEDFRLGLMESVRILRPNCRMLIADRDHEGSLLMRLFYFGGVAGMLEHADTRDLWDGSPGNMVRSRAFTAAEYRAMAESCNLRIVEELGISSLSLVLSYLRGEGKISADDEAHLAKVHALLAKLGMEGRMRRSHVLICEKPMNR